MEQTYPALRAPANRCGEGKYRCKIFPEDVSRNDGGSGYTFSILTEMIPSGPVVAIILKGNKGNKKLSDMKTNTIHTILLVEDDLDDQDFFTEALKVVDKSIRLITARDGEEALQKLQSETPDLILLDLNMPRMDGTSMLKEMKKTGQFEQIPVVIYSSFVVNCDRDEAVSLGVKQFVKKPIAVKETFETISRLLQDARQGFGTLVESSQTAVTA
jgi:CheY-like chemotaxis protein